MGIAAGSPRKAHLQFKQNAFPVGFRWVYSTAKALGRTISARSTNSARVGIVCYAVYFSNLRFLSLVMLRFLPTWLLLLLLLALDETGRASFHGSRPAPTPRPGQCGLGDHSVRLVRHARCPPPLPHADPYAIFSGCHLGRVALRLGKQVYQGVPLPSLSLRGLGASGST